jgi:ferritin
MISKKMAEALNAQINKELYSSYLYLSMAAYCRSEGLGGFAKWLGIQSSEERGHAMKIFGYLEDQGAKIQLAAIAAPATDFGSARRVFEETLAHEQFITASIHALVDLAIKEKDYATQGMLQWFVSEQVEEESVAADIVAKLKMIGGDVRGIFMVDRELGARAG